MKYFIQTFGCQMNVSDSERIASFIENKGFSLAESAEKAALVVFNTCGVRQSAENRAYTIIHNLRKKYKSKKIILTGCLAKRKDVQKRLKNKVDLFFAINEFEKFEKFLHHPERSEKSQYSSDSLHFAQNSINYLSISPIHNNKFQALLPIMTGCNNFCSYCVVPGARGREISRPAKEIEKEVRRLIGNNCKHIILLGQNVNSYHDNKTDFSDLLKKINSIPGRFWISFVSSHPKDFSNKLIETIAKSQKVCEFVHLPIQAGNNQILKRMNRCYTQSHYLELIKKTKKAFEKYKPSIPYSLTSDIIVGFPGETKKQFMDSARTMKKCRFDMVYFGQYSPRPETAAWKMKDDVSKQEKVNREKFLNNILAQTTFGNNKKYVGKIIEVLIDNKKNGYYFGHTRTMKNVKVVSNRKNLVGKIIKVKITKANIWNLEACLLVK